MLTSINPSSNLKLSIVATSRNDDHGGNALWRTQHFVNGVAAQANKHELKLELIIVDWNPMEGRPGLFDAIQWPMHTDYFSYRVIVVPKEHHQQLKSSEHQGLFQYLAKNVGIKRARGEFVLATNIDILFSDDLMKYMKNELKDGNLYRVDRFDIDDKLPETSNFDEILNFANTNIIRVHPTLKTVSFNDYENYKKQLNETNNSAFHILMRFIYKSVYYAFKKTISFSKFIFNHIFKTNTQYHDSEGKKIDNKISLIKKLKIIANMFGRDVWFFCLYNHLLKTPPVLPHTNACGDFTLLSKNDWEQLKGYPEWEMFSWHIDSIFLFQAYFSHIHMVNLDANYAIYHIEHGAGWTPETAAKLFAKLDAQNMEYLKDIDLQSMIKKQYKKFKLNQKTIYNETWGAPDELFVEKSCFDTNLIDQKSAI
jgi:hypothetical protein